jgi:hypothetical protein
MTRHFTIFLRQRLLLAQEWSHISENSVLGIGQAILLRQLQSLLKKSRKAGCKVYAMKSLVMTVPTKSLC